ncbi:MAG: zinc ribbon domain-containing protein [Candidatus Lokiarchaeota archaeon]|nr:zinc ribbon domain-containing protein [Candidatus Lokiarchaeota archaeon]
MLEIREKQDKFILVLLIMMLVCMAVECFVPFCVDINYDSSVYFRFWYVDPSYSPPVQPWFTRVQGVLGFIWGLAMLVLTGVSFIIVLWHKLNKMFLEKGAIIPFIIAGFSSFLWITAISFMICVPITDFFIAATGVATLILANLVRVGPWLRAPVSWKEALQVRTMEAGIFPMLLVLKHLQETKGSIDIMDLVRIYGRSKGTIKTKLSRAVQTHIIDGQFQGQLNFYLQTIRLPFVIDDADVPPSIQAVVASSLGMIGAISPTGSMQMANTVMPSSNIQPPVANVLAASGGAVTCPACGADVRGRDFCTNCGTKVTAGSPAPASDSAFCAACGNALKPGAEFCSKCGKKVA